VTQFAIVFARLWPGTSQAAAFVTSWQLALEAAGRTPGTVRFYTDSVRALRSSTSLVFALLRAAL
jgi:hypothetical protein